MNTRQAELMVEDLECKKSYPASFGTVCYLCDENIEPGDEVYYMGNGHKVCEACMGDLQNELANL